MSQEELLKNVQNMLNEEKFTRATLSNYSIDRFKELDIVINEAKEAHALGELKTLCDEHLSHTKNSIISVYFSGIAALSQQIIDDAVLVNLVSIFVDNRKWNIVKYLCYRILDYGESKFALRTLGDCYKNDGEEGKIYEVWKRLVKIDSEEADITKLLAERAEKEGDMDEAVEYFRKALHRYINKQLFTNVREIWAKLIGYHPEDIDFFLSVQSKVAKNISSEKAAVLMSDVYEAYKKRDEIDVSINILKLILSYDEHDNNARKEITECFRKRYASHSQVEEYIKVSNLTQSYRNVHEAISNFEKHIAFDKSNFVYHRTWGVGRISKVEGDEIIIDFAKHRDHKMGLKMAVNALQTLDKNHIWVLRATMSREKLHDKIKNDVEWAIKTVIKSFDNSCEFKKIKSELVPAILTAGEWTSWNNKAREVLKTDSSLGVSPDNINVWTVRDHSITPEEKLYTQFKAEKKFFKRVDIIREFAALESVDADSESLKEMANFFNTNLKNFNNADEVTITSYLLIKEISVIFPAIGAGLQLNFLNIFEHINNVSETYMAIKDSISQKTFLTQIKLFVPDWQVVYLKLFPVALDDTIIETLKTEGYEEKVVSMIRNCFDDYRTNRDCVIWFYKNYKEDPLFVRANISNEKIIITLINILDVTYREIDNQLASTENKKVNKQVWTILFKENLLNDYLSDADRETIIRIWTLLDDVKDLDPADKLKLKNRIIEKFPDFKFFGSAQKETVNRTLIVTVAKYEEKQRQLAKIMDEEVPANSKEIAFALSLGDLRENAEYKAAKEKQEILNSTVAKLKNEIERSQLFDPSTVNTTRVSFGTIVVLTNTVKGIDETYTLLGPWESDPQNKIISYMSPFGNSILNKRVGEQFDFEINDEKINYLVKEIKAAQL
ncbi:transcription elongation factor GreA [Spirochaetia bacterium]|nr:transcription elongation factor GreA [Spirochaetia bacterium]